MKINEMIKQQAESPDIIILLTDDDVIVTGGLVRNSDIHSSVCKKEVGCKRVS